MDPRRDYAGLGWTEWDTDDVSLAAMPLFHVGGLVWLLLGLHAGAHTVIASEFHPDEILDLIAGRRVTRLFLVPSALRLLVRRHAERPTDTATLRLILYGASPIPLDLLRESMVRFGCGFVQNYGMTETFGGIAALHPDEHSAEGADRMRSAGRALPGVEIAILDAEAAPMPVGEVGQVCIRSPANMLGYWNRPESTAEAVTADGWLLTGDAGYLDADGYLFIHDRMKDMIISGGENIYPSEVENAIFGHPKVADVAVVGITDDRWGETVKAFVVPRQGQVPTLEEIAAWTRTRIASFKAPRQMELVAALPRNAAGKVLRRVLRDG